MFSGHATEVLGGGIGLRQEIGDPAVGMTVYDVGDYVGQIGRRVDALELEDFDKRGGDRPMSAAVPLPRTPGSGVQTPQSPSIGLYALYPTGVQVPHSEHGHHAITATRER